MIAEANVMGCRVELDAVGEWQGNAHRSNRASAVDFCLTDELHFSITQGETWPGSKQEKICFLKTSKGKQRKR